MNCILTSIKNICNIEPSDMAFDHELIIFANSIFMILAQMGIGPKEGFSITRPDVCWDQFSDEPMIVNLASTYVGLRVRMLFDPPANSVLSEAITEQIKEAEWRLFAYTDVWSYD